MLGSALVAETAMPPEYTGQVRDTAHQTESSPARPGCLNVHSSRITVHNNNNILVY